MPPTRSGATAALLDAKKMALDVSVRKQPMLEVMDAQRKTVVQSIMHGKTLIFACQTACPDFAGKFNDTSAGLPEDELAGKPFPASTAENKAFLPLDLFDNGGRGYTTKDGVKKAEALFRPEEASAQNGGQAKIVDGFNIIVSTHFNYEDLDDFLFNGDYGLPLGKFFPIWIQHEDGTPAMS